MRADLAVRSRRMPDRLALLILCFAPACALLVELGMPQLPSGRRVELEMTSYDEASTGSVVWPAARALCRWQLGVADEISGGRVLELGAGTGACGLFAAGLGAQRVLLTDGGPPGVVGLMERNIERNRPTFAAGADVSAGRLLWGQGQPLPDGAFDWVLASDVAYQATREPLAFTLRQLLLAARPPRAVLALTRRGGAASVDDFLAAAATFGLRPAVLAETQEAKDSRAASGTGEQAQVVILELSLDASADVDAVNAAAAAPQAVADPRLVF